MSVVGVGPPVLVFGASVLAGSSSWLGSLVGTLPEILSLAV
jgi:hypothetical protein